MTDIYTTIEGGRDIALRFERLPEAIRSRLRRAIEGIAAEIALRQRAAAPRRTGRLASEVGQVTITETQASVRARITIAGRSAGDYAKAGALEYGAPGRRGQFTVSEYKRRGRGVGMEVIVDRYQRTARLMEYRFIRGPYQAMRTQIEEEMRDAVDEAIAETG